MLRLPIEMLRCFIVILWCFIATRDKILLLLKHSPLRSAHNLRSVAWAPLPSHRQDVQSLSQTNKIHVFSTYLSLWSQHKSLSAMMSLISSKSMWKTFEGQFQLFKTHEHLVLKLCQIDVQTCYLHKWLWRASVSFRSFIFGRYHLKIDDVNRQAHRSSRLYL